MPFGRGVAKTNSPIENIIDLLSDVRPQPQKLSVDAMEHRLQEVALAGILRVEEIQKSEHELAVDEALGDVRREVGRFEKAQEEFVDDLQMRPRRLQCRLVFFGIEFGSVRVRRRRQRAEEIDGELRGRDVRAMTTKSRRRISPFESLPGRRLR